MPSSSRTQRAALGNDQQRWQSAGQGTKTNMQFAAGAVWTCPLSSPEQVLSGALRHKCATDHNAEVVGSNPGGPAWMRSATSSPCLGPCMQRFKGLGGPKTLIPCQKSIPQSVLVGDPPKEC